MEREMQLKANASVTTADGEKIGEIDRIVIDPKTDEITHLVVRKGFLLTEDKVVPASWISTAAGEPIVLNASEEMVNSLPNFEETHYIPRSDRLYSEEYAQPYIWYPGAGVNWWGDPGYRTYFGSELTPFAKVKTRATPVGTVPLKEGAKVYSSDDRHVGNIERIFADPDSQRATHFVVEAGLIFKERKLLPTSWIDVLAEDEVFLGVSADFLDKLVPYKG